MASIARAQMSTGAATESPPENDSDTTTASLWFDHPEGPSFPIVPELIPLPPIDLTEDLPLEAEVLSEPVTEATELSPPQRKVGSPFGKSAPFALGGFWAPKVDVEGQATTLAMNGQYARASLPLVKPVEGEGLWIGIAKVDRLELATSAVLPDSGLDVPNQLWSVQTGAMHMRPLASGSTVGGTMMFGSASDRPYAATRDLTLTAIGFWNRPAKNERDDWNFSIFYSPTSQLPYPLPGIAYVWRPNETLEAKIGLPPALDYRPNEDWHFSAAYMPLTNFDARVRRHLSDDLSLLAYYRTNNETYFLADRLEDDQRFFVFDQRAAVGLEQSLMGGFSLEMTAAYLFDRQLFQGTSFTDDRTDEVEFDPGLGLLFQLMWRR